MFKGKPTKVIITGEAKEEFDDKSCESAIKLKFRLLILQKFQQYLICKIQ